MDHNAITVDTLLRTNNGGSIVFDFRLVNKLDREVRLNGAVVNWTYRGGMQSSIGHGDIFERASRSPVVQQPGFIEGGNTTTE